MPPSDERDLERTDEPPPILGSWSRLYLLVIAVLAGLIALFTWFTIAFE
jgi:hypothetical protein